MEYIKAMIRIIIISRWSASGVYLKQGISVNTSSILEIHVI